MLCNLNYCHCCRMYMGRPGLYRQEGWQVQGGRQEVQGVQGMQGMQEVQEVQGIQEMAGMQEVQGVWQGQGFRGKALGQLHQVVKPI